VFGILLGIGLSVMVLGAITFAFRNHIWPDAPEEDPLQDIPVQGEKSGGHEEEEDISVPADGKNPIDGHHADHAHSDTSAGGVGDGEQLHDGEGVVFAAEEQPAEAAVAVPHTLADDMSPRQ
jgi:hypothetical protein